MRVALDNVSTRDYLGGNLICVQVGMVVWVTMAMD